MREIKFRAYHAPLGYSEPFGLGGAPVWIDSEGFEQAVSYWANLCQIFQYTGLKDKNGKDIYEGDIVSNYIHDPDRSFRVVFNASKYNCGFVATDNDDCNPYIHIWYDGLEIIGNIHD